jgi:hypothetical protein
MFDFFARPKLGSDAIPRRLTTLGVSWLNDQFKAVSVHRGEVEATWERPGEVEGALTFETLLREAVQQTGYRGQSVSLLVAHPRLVQQLVDVPPVTGAPLRKVIQRQAQQQKMFPGEAAWASQTSPSGKGAHRVVLHLFPRLTLNQFIQGCRRNGLHLTSVMPASAVLHHQITQLPLQKDQVALLAAETGGSTTLVVGRSDGQILLARTLPGTWNQDAERLAVDLHRTILFVSQQSGVALGQGVWLFGPGAQAQMAAMQRHIQLPVHVSPVAYGPFYWATETVKLRPELNPNFISREQQQAPQRRTFAKVVAASTALVVLASLGGSAYFLRQARQEAASVKLLSRQAARLQLKQEDLQRLDDELSRKQQVTRLVLGERPPPTPAWLLAYLGEAVPSDLVLTNLEIKRHDDLWRVRLAGTFQQTVKPPALPVSASSLALLKARLAGEPFHLKFLEPADNAPKPTPAPQPAKAGPAEGAAPGWLDRITSDLTAKPVPAKPVVQDHFVLEGVML